MEFIYIITSPENEHFNKYKIGRTSNPDQKDLFRRYHTPLPEMKLIEFISVYNSKLVEESIHKILDEYRVPKSEWFKGDLKLFKQTVYAECFRNKCQKTFIRNEVLSQIFIWFQKHFDPYCLFDMIEEDESEMELKIAAHRFCCPITSQIHIENRFHKLKINFQGDVTFFCSTCQKKKKLGNCGFKSVFLEDESQFEPSKKIQDLVHKLEFLGYSIQEIGHHHVKTKTGILDLEDEFVYSRDDIVLHILDDVNKRKLWNEFQAKYSLQRYECVSCQDKIKLKNLTGECYSYNTCIDYELEGNKLICIDCGFVKEFEQEEDNQDVHDVVVKKVETKFLRMEENRFFYQECLCPVHKEVHELVVELRKDGSIHCVCKAKNPLNAFAYSLLGEIDRIQVEGKWKNIYQNWENSRESYKSFCIWLKKYTTRKPISFAEWTKKMNLLAI